MFSIKTVKIFKTFRFLFFPLYLLSFLIPKKKNVWLFGAHQNRFSENTKALYLYTSKNIQSIQAIWITNDTKLVKQLNKDKYISYKKWSLKGLYFSLRAQYYFYNVYSDDINFYTSGNTTLVNLWHGIPLKHIEFDIQKGPLKRIFNSSLSLIYFFFKPYLFKKPNYVLSTSEVTTKIFSSAFKIRKEQCLELSYPRADQFFTKQHTKTQFYKKIEALKILKKSKILIYMPTWRSEGNTLSKAIPDFNTLNNQLLSSNSIFIIKTHPNDFHEQHTYSNIFFIHPLDDIYNILPLSDFLITDYSSIYFDYLLLDKEIIFYAYDFDFYSNNEREFYFDYKKVTPGKMVYTFQDLLLLFPQLHKLDFKKERLNIKNKFWKYQDENSAKRIVNFFQEKDK